MSRFIALYSVLAGAVLPEDKSSWLEHTANGLAKVKLGRISKLAAALEAWKNSDGNRMTNEVYADKGTVSTAPIEAKAAVLVLAGDLFGVQDPVRIPDNIVKELKTICFWSVREAPLHVQHTAKLLFELEDSKEGFENLIRHTPLANYLPICRPTQVIPFMLVQAAIQNSVYRDLINRDDERSNLVAPDNISAVEQTLIEICNFAPRELIYGVSRPTLDKLFFGLFRSGEKETYFDLDERSDTFTLKYPPKSSKYTKAVYLGIGRALALSVVLGAPIGHVHFPKDFAKMILGKARCRSELETEVQIGFNNVITSEIVNNSQLTEEELVAIWQGAVLHMPEVSELVQMIKFPSGSSEQSIRLFMLKLENHRAYREEFIRKALGIWNWTVGRANAVYPPITVYFGKDSKKFNIEHTDNTKHVVKLV